MITSLYRKLLINRNLGLLWLGQVISQSGDSIYQIGLLWLVLELSGSETVTGFAAMSAYLPALLFALIAGAAADRHDKRRMMIASDIARIVVILAVPVLALLNLLSPLTLAINAFFIVSASVFFYPARDALVPRIVPADRLMRANTMIQTSWQFSLLLGPAVAAILLEYFGKVHLFSVDTLFYAGSLLCVFLMVTPREVRVEGHTGSSWHEIVEGLRYVVKQPVILPLLFLTIADNLLIMGPATVGTPVFVKNELHLGATAYATTEFSYAIGMLIGTGLMLWIGDRFSKGKLLLIGMFLDGITFIPVWWVDSLLMLQIIFVIHSMAIPLLMVPRASLVQQIVPSELTGRVFALINLAVTGMSAISAGLTGLAIQLFGVRELFVAIGIGGGLCGVIGWITMQSLRTTR